MDTGTQIILGAAVAVAVMGRSTAPSKAALWGGLCGLAPDLDVLIDHGDAITNMVRHRAESHALFWLTLCSVPLAAGVAAWHRESRNWKRWWLALWLALVTHPLLDLMTVYGTQLLRPFTDYPYAVGSVFIIDPLYTLPLLVGLLVALAWRSNPNRWRWSLGGLTLSTAYLAWGAMVQQHLLYIAERDLRAQKIDYQRVLVTPAPLQSLLWRVVVVGRDARYEGFRSLLDGDRPIRFDRFDNGAALGELLRDDARVAALARFSKGFHTFDLAGPRIVMSDLRMGQEGGYVFAFVVAERHSPPVAVTPSVSVGGRSDDLGAAFKWLWHRMLGADVDPPR